MSLDFLKKSLENKNVKAFLKTIRRCEGTDAQDGYAYLFGSSVLNNKRIKDFTEHPNKAEKFGSSNSSTAAGAYQILFKVWRPIQVKYNLPDFSPASQDLACVELISERNVLQKLMDGKLSEVLNACSPVWASLPGAGYGQPEKKLSTVIGWYKNEGGIIT